MKKLFLGLLISSMSVLASEDTLNFEVTGTKLNGGNVYLAIYDSEASYKSDSPFKTIKTEGKDGIVNFSSEIINGDYVFAVYQDKNGNEKLDTNFLGIPKEKYALSNYNRIGWPGGFKKLKVNINKNIKKIVLDLK